MRTTIVFILILSTLGCKSERSSKMILGNWKMKSWINLKNKSDLLKNPQAPVYKINFTKDSVYVSEKES